MLFLFLVAASLAVSDAMVCFHGICDHLQKHSELKCQGSVVKNGGLCGCYDVCAKIEGEPCEAQSMRGRPSLGTCDKGLQCEHQDHMILGAGICVKDNHSIQARSGNQTLCQRRRIQSMIVMVVYRGQWFPKCDIEGKFQPQQCDNTGTCFCVDVDTGAVDKSTKVLGSAECRPGYKITNQTH